MVRSVTTFFGTIVGLVAWLLVWGGALQVSAAICNICGCDNCEPGNLLAIVEFPNPQDPNSTLRNNCQSLYQIANRTDNPFNQQQCDELYKIVTVVCNCFYANGTDVPKYDGVTDGGDDANGDNEDDNGSNSNNGNGGGSGSETSGGSGSSSNGQDNQSSSASSTSLRQATAAITTTGVLFVATVLIALSVST